MKRVSSTANESHFFEGTPTQLIHSLAASLASTACCYVGLCVQKTKVKRKRASVLKRITHRHGFSPPFSLSQDPLLLHTLSSLSSYIPLSFPLFSSPASSSLLVVCSLSLPCWLKKGKKKKARVGIGVTRRRS